MKPLEHKVVGMNNRGIILFFFYYDNFAVVELYRAKAFS